MPSTKRYSDKELELFKTHIEQKLSKSENDLTFLLDRIQDISEATDNVGDWMDDTSGSDLEMLYIMARRHRQHIQDLENALLRIHHKNYGICIVTNELIDKRRLLAVPTTTKSLAAKNAILLNAQKETHKPTATSKTPPPKMITTVVKKVATPTKAKALQEEIEDDYLDEESVFHDTDYDKMPIDLEDFSD